jgi:hypothetical protein
VESVGEFRDIFESGAIMESGGELRDIFESGNIVGLGGLGGLEKLE